MVMTEDRSKNPGCLGAFLRLFGINVNPEKSEELPYRLRDDFLSQAELSFYHVLRTVTGDNAVICSKVNLADIFFVVKPNENLAYRNKIDRKHVDFLLCDAQSLRPIVGVELDDASHKRADRQARDAFVDSVFKTAELPLIHVPARATYNVSELTALLASYFERSATLHVAEPPKLSVHTGDAPVCDKCGIPMVMRTTSRGDRKGERFWGCANYPKCRKVVAVTNTKQT
jgi:hypothetical protein